MYLHRSLSLSLEPSARAYCATAARRQPGINYGPIRWRKIPANQLIPRTRIPPPLSLQSQAKTKPKKKDTEKRDYSALIRVRLYAHIGVCIYIYTYTVYRDYSRAYLIKHDAARKSSPKTSRRCSSGPTRILSRIRKRRREREIGSTMAALSLSLAPVSLLLCCSYLYMLYT